MKMHEHRVMIVAGVSAVIIASIATVSGVRMFRKSVARKASYVDPGVLVEVVKQLSKPGGADQWPILLELAAKIQPMCCGLDVKEPFWDIRERKSLLDLRRWLVHYVSRLIVIVAREEVGDTNDSELKKWIDLWENIYDGFCYYKSSEWLQPLINQLMVLDGDVAAKLQSKLQKSVDMQWKGRFELDNELDEIMLNFALRMPLKSIRLGDTNNFSWLGS